MKPSAKLDDALDAVRAQIEAVVRQEQLTDQLTGMGNQFALDEWLKQEIEDDNRFWCALVELDHFKRVNTAVGYENADLLLQRVGKRLQLLEDYVGAILPIRAHGDEFFAAGSLSNPDDTGAVEVALEQLRREIALLSITVGAKRVSCTASIGWAASVDVGEAVLTPRRMIQLLEIATDEAKGRGRDQVVRYSAAIRKPEIRTVRDNCASCRAAFSVDVPMVNEQADKMFCPNCGFRIARPS